MICQGRIYSRYDEDPKKVRDRGDSIVYHHDRLVKGGVRAVVTDDDDTFYAETELEQGKRDAYYAARKLITKHIKEGK